MQISETLLIRIFVIILCILSIAGCSLIIWTFFKIPKLSKNPGNIIQRMTIAQIFIAFQLLFAQFYYQNTQNTLQSQPGFPISQTFCTILAFIDIFTASEYILYNLYFSINLYCSLQIENYNFSKYFKYMELSSLLFSICITIAFYIISEFGINIAGVCGLQPGQFKAISIILLIITLIIIIFIVLVLLSKQTFKNALYDKNQTKFLQKYHLQFIIVNVLYTIVFLLTYMIPSCLIFWSNLFQTNKIYNHFLPIINPLGGILLFLIRINDPIVKKSVFLTLFGRKKSESYFQLKEKLLKQDEYKVRNESGLEISVCNTNTKLRYTVRPIQSENLIENSKFNSQNFSQKTQFGSNSQQKLIKNNLELFIILLSIKNAVNSNIKSDQTNIKNLKAWNFNHITKYQLHLKYDKKELEQQYKQFNNLQLKDYINQENYKQIIECYSYASSTLIDSFSQILNIDLTQLSQSLRINENTQNIINTKLPQQLGTIFLTYDSYFTIDIISKSQKLLLTKGGGLMNICKRYQTEYTKATKNGNTLLPAIFGLYTIQIDEDRYINVVLKLNQLKIRFPLQQYQLNIQEEQDQLIQQDIFGWIQINNQFGQIKLFIAEKLYDGKFQIQIEVQILYMKDSDFKLSKLAIQELLTIIGKDIDTFCFSKNICLSIVYFKFPTIRLDSMCNHRDSFTQHYQICKNGQQFTPLQKNENFQGLGQFELESKIGFVRVFYDNFWNNEWEYINEDEKSYYFEKLMQHLTDSI